MKTLYMILFPIITCSALANPADEIMKQRKLNMLKAEKLYLRAVSDIDKRTVMRLNRLLKQNVESGNENEARRVRRIIDKITSDNIRKIPVAGQNTAKKTGTVRSSDESAGGTSGKEKAYPKGTFKKFGHHYYIFPLKMNKPDAENSCLLLGGHILSIETPGEYKFFHELSVREKKPLWLDLTREKPGAPWLNWKKEKALFLKWFAGKYKKDDSSNHIAINVNNSGADMVCLNGYRFGNYVICEWEK